MFVEVCSFLFACHTIFWLCAFAARWVTLAWYKGPVQLSMMIVGFAYGVAMFVWVCEGAKERWLTGSGVSLVAINMFFASVTWFWAAFHYELLEMKRVLRQVQAKHDIDIAPLREMCDRRGIHGLALERIEKLHAAKSPLLGGDLPGTFDDYVKLLLDRDAQMTVREKALQDDRRFFQSLWTAGREKPPF
jgi:hypothetical protein